MNLSLLRSVLLAIVAAGCGDTAGGAAPAPSDRRPVIAIAVGPKGYEPSEVKAAAGKPVRLSFTRTSDEGCGQKLVIPSEKVEKDLPLGQAVAVDLTMPASGKIGFTCGMGMLKGAVVAE